MSGEAYGGGVDVDLLADYACGVLDGTPAADEVAGLIASAPDWAVAYRALAAADATVRDQLAGLAAAPEPMPADVIARLDAALAAEAATRRPRPHETTAPTPTSPAVPTRPALSVAPVTPTGPAAPTGPGSAADPEGRSGPSAGPGGKVVQLDARRRRYRWLGPVAAAAALIAVGGGVGAALFGLTGNERNTGGSATAPLSAASGSGSGKPNLAEPGPAGAAQDAPPPSGTSFPRSDGTMGKDSAAPRLVASGTNYTRATVQSLAAGAPQVFVESQVPPQVERLLAPGARADCLRAVTAAHPGTPTVVDFARYEGEPALVVVLADAHLVVVAGPNCGLSGADERAAVGVR